MQLDESFMVYALLVPGKNGIAYYPVLGCLHLCDVPIWEALPCSEWSDAILSCHWETGLWFSYSGHPESVM
jgi:hypothetical protein